MNNELLINLECYRGYIRPECDIYNMSGAEVVNFQMVLVYIDQNYKGE